MWNKLQKTNKDIKSKARSDSKSKGLPPVSINVYNSQGSQSNVVNNNTKPLPVRKAPSITKPTKKDESNHIERNVEIIKNKENLVHRYPEKKYEVVYGKNLSSRVKNIQG